MFQRWVLPGVLFQSVLVGGGYATGRELVEFFLVHGPLGGLLGILSSTVFISMVAVVFYEFARVTASFTYQQFFRKLIGKAAFLFELGYLLLGVLVLSVVGAAAGEIAESALGVTPSSGTVFMCICIVYTVFRGTGFLEHALAAWSFLLYGVYGVFITWFLANHGGALADNLSKAPLSASWVRGSLEYVGYNLVVLPVIVFVVRHFRGRRDALLAGALTGPMAMLPAIFFYMAMAADYQAVLKESVPADYLIRALDVAWLKVLFYLTVFGTFVETGSAFLHALNERISGACTARGRDFNDYHRALVATACLIVAILLADRFGLVELIASGYRALTWYFIAIFVMPLFTIGLARILRSRGIGDHPVQQ